MITIEGVSKSFRNGRFGQESKVLKNVDIEIAKGEVVGLIGESGCGKTTLAMILMKLLEPDNGRVTIDGMEITDIGQRAYRKNRGFVQMVFQNPHASFNPQRTISWSLNEAYSSFGKNPDFKKLLKDFNLPPDVLNRKPYTISGGELQRLSIIRSLASDPDYLILDEPTSMLDLSIQAGIMNKLMEYKGSKGMLLITHDIDLAACVCDRVYIMENGQTIRHGGVPDMIVENFDFQSGWVT